MASRDTPAARRTGRIKGTMISQDIPVTIVPDLKAIKARQRSTWASGDFGRIGVRLQIAGELLCEAADVQAIDRVLDVAAGNGNASLAAARRFAAVTSTDYVPDLLEQGRERADADRLQITFKTADAENLPFEEGAFDVALSTFGVMFAPDQERAASELLRVTRPGGRIGLASWTPEGFVGRMFDVVQAFVPSAAGLRSPMTWGTETRLVELFGPACRDIRTQRRICALHQISARQWVDYFRAYYGPVHRAFGALDAAGQASLHEELTRLATEWNRSDRGALVLPAEYLEAVITR